MAHRLQHSLEREHWDRLIALLTEALLESPSLRLASGIIPSSRAIPRMRSPPGCGEKECLMLGRIAPVFVGAGLETRALDDLRDFSAKGRLWRRGAMDRFADEA